MSYSLRGELPVDTGSRSNTPREFNAGEFIQPEVSGAEVWRTDYTATEVRVTETAARLGSMSMGRSFPDGMPGMGLRKPIDDRRF